MTVILARCAPVTVSATVSLMTFSADTNRPVIIHEFTISTNGTDSTKAPIEFQLVRCSTSGTGASLSLSISDERDTTGLGVTALETISAEPTVVEVLRSFYVPVYQSSLIYVPPKQIVIAGGGFAALKVVGSPSPSISVISTAVLEE